MCINLCPRSAIISLVSEVSYLETFIEIRLQLSELPVSCFLFTHTYTKTDGFTQSHYLFYRSSLHYLVVVVKTGAISRAKLQSNHNQQQTNTQLFTGRMPFLSPNHQCQKVFKYQRQYLGIYILFKYRHKLQ